MIVEGVLVSYLILVLLIGIYEYRKTKGLLDFYLAGKKLGTLVVSFSFLPPTSVPQHSSVVVELDSCWDSSGPLS